MAPAVDDEGGTVVVSHDDITLARYRAETPASRPHFDVVALPAGAGATAGRNLVLAAPHDHPWHLGLSFCQKLVDGVNCWAGELHEAEGRRHGFAVDGGYEVDAGGDAVTISHAAEWRTDEGEALLADEREVTVAEPDGGAYTIEWRQAVRALECRRHLTSETFHGHYSGLTARLARSMADGRILLPDEENPEDRSGPQAPWCDYSGALDGRVASTDPWRAGLTFMADPENPDPTRWYTLRGMPFVAANPTWERTVALAEGETRTWRWGVRVHAGGSDRDAAAAAHERFAGR